MSRTGAPRRGCGGDRVSPARCASSWPRSARGSWRWTAMRRLRRARSDRPDRGPPPPAGIPREYGVTSPPIVVRDLVIVGSAVADNHRTDAPEGVIRAFDVRSGALRWSFDPVPRRPQDAGYDTWIGPTVHTTGAANAWSVFAALGDRGYVETVSLHFFHHRSFPWIAPSASPPSFSPATLQPPPSILPRRSEAGASAARGTARAWWVRRTAWWRLLCSRPRLTAKGGR